MDRQKGLVEYIYKLINSNFRYRKYKIHDKSFVVHFVYNLFYSMFNLMVCVNFMTKLY